MSSGFLRWGNDYLDHSIAPGYNYTVIIFLIFSSSSSHWYLAVICFAGHTDAKYINEIPDEDDEPKVL